ncbi:MAG: hypothetical protein DMG63_03850 [Acidobacteria bacterium]|nr:MAG: hypothetical protein DMG63_03850 [Acidobacteriota bacterium]
MDLKGNKITWLGHATFHIETASGKSILIDPWVMNNPACPNDKKSFKKIDVMLCTHGHGDHIGDAVELTKKHNPKIVAPLSTPISTTFCPVKSREICSPISATRLEI